MDVYGQMALDEALLDSGPEFVLRFYRWAKRPAVTFGYFQRYAEVEAASRGIARIVRRPTGGGIVYHEDDVTFSFIFRQDGSLTPQAIYRNIHRGVHLGLKTLKLSASLWSPPGWREGERKVAAQCFVAPEPMDLVAADGRKILGGALRKRKRHVLYQGSLQAPGPVGALEQAVARGFEQEWSVVLSARKAAPELLAAARDLRQRYLSDDWNRKR